MMKSAACLLALAILAAQPAPAFASDQVAPQQAALSDARAIVDTVLPPAQRQEMIRTLMQQMGSQILQAMPLTGGIDDPGLQKLIQGSYARMMEALMPRVDAFLPKLAEAMAVAYTQEFEAAELKEIRAFAETPAGHRYLSRSMAIAGSPVVAEANQAYLRDLGPLLDAQRQMLKAELTSYLEAHPELAAKLSASRPQ